MTKILNKNQFSIFSILKESKKDIKELQEILLVRYMKETVQPIVDQIEVNLYAGRYDFNDSSPPISN